jgi:Na+/melibiose symporter-like transporter
MLSLAILLLASGGFIGTATVPFYVTYFVRRPELLGPLLGTATVGTILGILAGVRIVAVRLGKRSTLGTGLALSATCTLGLFLTPAGAVPVQFALFGLGAVGSGFGLSVIWSMISDTVEYGEWRTGMRIEGGTYSVASFVVKLSSAVAGAVTPMILSLTGYVPNADQTELARSGILWMVSLVPFLFAALGLVPVLLYRLDEAMFDRILADLADRQRESTA